MYYLKINGSYQEITQTFIKIDGEYKTVSSYVKINGEYKLINNNKDTPKYSLNKINLLVSKGDLISIPVSILNTKPSDTILWDFRVDAGDFNITNKDLTTCLLNTNLLSSKGAIWCSINGVELGEIPVIINYGG